MHTVDLLDHALTVAQSLGIKVRQDWLGGANGGICEIKGQRYLFLDVTSSPPEQLDRVLNALQNEPRLAQAEIPSDLRRLLRIRRTA
jgi:hypothetical protein